MAAVLPDEDLLAFVDPRDFGEEVILPGGTAVFGIFDEPGAGLEPGTSVEVSTTSPKLTLRVADAGDLRQGGTVEILGRRFEVVSRDDDAAGFAVMPLFEI
jgi:hypothetical protein